MSTGHCHLRHCWCPHESRQRADAGATCPHLWSFPPGRRQGSWRPAQAAEGGKKKRPAPHLERPGHSEAGSECPGACWSLVLLPVCPSTWAPRSWGAEGALGAVLPRSWGQGAALGLGRLQRRVASTLGPGSLAEPAGDSGSSAFPEGTPQAEGRAGLLCPGQGPRGRGGDGGGGRGCTVLTVRLRVLLEEGGTWHGRGGRCDALRGWTLAARVPVTLGQLPTGSHFGLPAGHP